MDVRQLATLVAIADHGTLSVSFARLGSASADAQRMVEEHIRFRGFLALLEDEIADLAELPTKEENHDFYRDNRQTWVYHKSVGVGECAGEVVDQAEFMLNDADRLQFEATIALDEGRTQEAAQKALQAQMKAADALLFANR